MSELSALINKFPGQRILVIGDVILDHYVRGNVSRTSPEAPVPILEVEDEEWLPGGAANVANNLVSMGAKVTLVGLCGNDEGGEKLREIFGKIDRLTAKLIAEKGRPTILKTRCVAQGQQMIRLDRERIMAPSPKTAETVLASIRREMKDCSGVILSDYGKGFLQPELIQQILSVVKEKGLSVFVDPKGRDYTRYRGVTLLTPNQKEASDATGIAITDNASAAEAAKLLQKTVQGEAVVITRGAAGVSVFPRKGTPHHLPARAREVYDVTGAGDTFLSVLALASFSGASWSEAAELGNLAAGIVVGMAGVACITPDALRAATEAESLPGRRKIVDALELEQVCRSMRQHGSRIVFTNGFFDLLHQGHLRLLQQARGLGDVLIVALNSDASTRRLKGSPRPILQYRERAEMLSAFPFVDFVTEFDGDTPEALLERLRPDILVKGSPTGTATDVVGRSIVEGYGGQIRLVELKDVPSVSGILARAIPAAARPATKRSPKGSPKK